MRTVFLMVLVPAMVSAQISIFRPKIGVPAFPLTNGTFHVEIESAPGLATNTWSALLVNDLRSWTCSVERVDYGRFVNCNSTTGYLLTVRTPAAIAPEIFHLVVNHVSGGGATNRHSVKILPNYETNFYILHYADPQVETENATSPNGAGGSYGSVQAIYWASHAYSLINPRFMFNTGDEVENGVAGMYPKYLDAIATLKVPLLITRGNNDAKGNYNNWKRDIGQSTYSVTMGSFYVCMKDYATNDNLTWFTNDYQEACTNADITFRLFGQHYNSGESSYAPPSGQYPDLMLVGHNHAFATLSTTPYYVLSSGPGWDYGAVAIFEFVKSGGGWICSNKTIHGTNNKLQMYGDWGQPCRVTNTYLYENNGTALTNTTYITNSLNYDFWDGRVRFLMRKTASGYAVSGGEKIAEYDYTGTNTAVLVKVNIRQNTLTPVTVSPLGEQSLPAPTNVTASNGRYTGKVALTWNGVPNATGYQIWRHTASDPASARTMNHGSQTNYDDATASTGVRYYYWVKATNAYGASAFSSSATGWRKNFAARVCDDYDGDGIADLAVYRNGYWSIYSLANGLILYNQGPWGGPNSIRVPGDYDGDGIADLAVYSDGYWSIYSLATGLILYNEGIWGGPDWTPVPGDYDSDGKSDLTVYRNGYWSIYSLANGLIFYNEGIWGGSGWTPVPGDYDGDGKSDFAVYRNGYWSIFSLASGLIFYNEGVWGGSGWTPVPGDYDGDGKDDLAVYRNGYWSIYSLAHGLIIYNQGVWGGPGWTPVQ